MKRLIVIGCTSFLATACQTTVQHDPRPNDPMFAPIIPEMPVQRVSDNGSIFNPMLVNSLYSDAKARRIGDIITVILRENTSATKSASTTQSRENEMRLDPITGSNGQNVLIGGDSLQFSIDAGSDFSGDAAANQSNNLSGNISVTVVRVLPNGNLVVRGEKWLTLNNGDEYIRLTGIVRTQDINPANEVISTKIANARIQYSGTGSFAKSQETGWLTKFFHSDWWPL